MRPFLLHFVLAVLAPAVLANARPQATPDRFLLRTGQSLDVLAPGVLDNDTDADGDPLFATPVDPVSAGQLLLFQDGSFSYTPDARFRGSDRFTYRACDDDGCSDPAEVHIASDGIAAPLAARPDRVERVTGSGAFELDVLANDAYAAERLAGGRLDVVSAPSLGSVEVLAADGAPTGLRYRPNADEVGTDRFRYRLCEASSRCTEADVEVVLQPFAPVWLDVSAAAGRQDLPFRGLPSLPAPTLTITAAAKPTRLAYPLAVDATPLEPWAGGGTGLTVFTLEGGESGRDARVLVELDGGEADVDLYMGVDDDANRRASRDEMDCVSAGSDGVESCTLDLNVAADNRLTWWALAHNRGGRRVEVRMSVFEVDATEGSSIAWTAPGRLEAGADGAFRLSFVDTAFTPGDASQAWIRVESEAGTRIGWVPLRLVGDRPEVAPRLLRAGETVRFDLPAGIDADRLVLDVPEGASAFEIEAVAGGDIELAMFRVPAPSMGRMEAELPALPAGAVPEVVVRAVDGVAKAVREGAVGGRWMLRVRGAGEALPEVSVSAAVTVRDGAEALLRPGLYAPPSRPGEGLLVDRTGSDWAAVWYAFDESGASTWFYLQGGEPAPGAAWAPTVYRSAVGGGGQRLAAVGRASLAVVDGEGPVFSFEVEGRAGSQRLVDFGRGCPEYRDEPRDLSGLWYDPEIAGEGYGLWLVPAYEFQALFLHDARGLPRYVVAEAAGFSTDGDRLLDLVAYRGACLFCPSAPRRGEVVGRLHRQFAPALTPLLVDLGTRFGTGVTGSIERRDVLERLGGTKGGLGCPDKP